MYLISGGKTYTLPLNTDGTIKPTLVTKDNNGNTVVDVKDLNITVAYEDANKTIGELEAKYLPQKVAVFMKDDTVQQLPVDWDIKNRKYNGQGIYTYTGTVLGHGKQIKCTLTIPSEMLNATSIIEVYNNGPKNGSIMIKERSFGPSKQDQELKEKLKLAKRVEIGDVIKVYDNPNSEKPLGNIKVDANNANGPLVKSLDLDMYGRSFWITITRKNKAESKPTEVRQLGAAVLSGDVLDEDGEALGVDGRDFTVKGWNNPSIRDDGFISDTTEIAAQGTKSIYVIPGTGKLNMENQGVIPAGITSANYWNGGNARALLTNYDLLTNDSLKIN
ncbi:Ig-like domain-containing protein [Clostridium botulinum]|nr:Ig-like domain-containing protein [Clostridium botulinum]MCS4516405.1 Ig-like domain-containing protein [Clostridium botulinum]